MKKLLRKIKYHNYSCHCNQGHWHQSRGEAGYCNQLAIFKKASGIKDYEIQKTYSLDVNGKHITNHRVDFVITRIDGQIEVREFKGFETETWLIKKRLFEVLYPEIPYEVIRK